MLSYVNLFFWYILVLDSFVYSSSGYFITVPDVIRVDTDSIACIDIKDINSLPIQLSLQEYPQRHKTYSVKRTVVSSGLNNVTIRLDSKDISSNASSKEYVYLKVETTDSNRTPTFSEERVLLISRQSGFIFIQTDKTIYTPDQEVKIRVVPLTENKELSKDPVLIEVKNPQGVIVQRWNSTWDRTFISHKFQLPNTPYYGNNWTILAKFAGNDAVKSQVMFEVKEYVLPRFSVLIDVKTTDIILPTTEQIQVDVKSRYVYGKPVSGEAYLTLGIQADGRYEMCPFRLTERLISGIATFNITVDDIATTLQHFWFPDGARLQIKADVMDTAAGRKESAIDKSVVFAHRPYKISFDTSRYYFKPGLRYDLTISVFWANRHPAPNVPVSLRTTKTSKFGIDEIEITHGFTTNHEGMVTFQITTSATDNHMQFVISTIDPQYEDGQQARSVLDVNAMRSLSNNFISVKAYTVIDNVLVTVECSDRTSRNVTYLILSNGRIVVSGVVSISNGSHTMALPIQGSMAPKSRFVVYYIQQTSRGPRVISDSFELKIEGRCNNEQLSIDIVNTTLLPGGMTTISVAGSPDAVVGFLAVDKAIFLMNKTTVLNMKSINAIFGRHSTDCGAGGGYNNRQIFQDAGLSVISNTNLRTTRRKDTGCNKLTRKKRSTGNNIQNIISTHPCCVAGDMFSRGVNDSDQCFNEGKNVYSLTNSTGCAKVFYKCCKQYSQREELAGPVGIRENDDEPIYVVGGRNLDSDDIEYTFRDIDVDLSTVQMRSYFPESWLFEETYLDNSGNGTKFLQAPHSISSHIIQAISVSSAGGLCVADNQELVVFRDFFVDVDLPYSIVRMEQTEIRATIYNYGNKTLPCRIYMNTTDDVCSSKTGAILVRVGPRNTETVRFPIVPLRAGTFPVEVIVRSVGIGDWVRKSVFVINEGKEEMKTVSFWVDPHGQKGRQRGQGDLQVNITHPLTTFGVQQTDVDLVLPEDVIPGTAECTASATGNIMDSTVLSAIENVDKMLNRIPHGCGEQTMITLAPIVYALRYLYGTNQIQAHHKARGQRLINIGVQKQLMFRKTNGSFAVWPHKPSSTWLTAFVMKVFCEAQRYYPIDRHVICSGMKYLLSQQRANGAFQDSFPVYHKEMLGGNIGDVSRTAFVLIALQECDCRPKRTDRNIRRAVRYLETKLRYIRQVYPLAITTYALALSNSRRRFAANRKLKRKATNKLFSQTTTNGFRFWSVRNEPDIRNRSRWYRKNAAAIDVEVTSYALLAQLELDEVEYCKNIVEWLLDQRQASREFVSTQDTVIALYALSVYNIRTYAREIDMRLSLSSSANATFHHRMVLTQNDALVQKSVNNIPVDGKLKVHSEGSGVARMDVQVRYNKNISEHEQCKFNIEVFDSDVKVDILHAKGYTPDDLNCDVCGYCTQIDPNDFAEIRDRFNVPDLDPRIRGMSRQQKRSIGNHGASKQQKCLEVCVSYLGYETLDMPVIDVGLPTGFRAQEEDLKKLQSKTDIENYELSKRSVTFYLDNIPSNDDLCFKFRVEKQFEVENLQAAKIEAYDFYKEDERCVKFYSLKYDVAELDVFCSKGNCTCVEASCAESWDTKLEYRQISKSKLLQNTCNKYDYVIRVEVTNTMVTGNHMVFSTTVHSVLRAGRGNLQQNDEIEFWMNLRCSTDVEVDNYYMIYGKHSVPYIDARGNHRYRYYLQGETAVFKDYTRSRYTTNHTLRYWGRFIRIMERFIKRRGC